MYCDVQLLLLVCIDVCWYRSTLAGLITLWLSCIITNVDPSQEANFSEEISEWQIGASVPLSRESPITNTLCTFFVALVLMQVFD